MSLEKGFRLKVLRVLKVLILEEALGKIGRAPSTGLRKNRELEFDRQLQLLHPQQRCHMARFVYLRSNSTGLSAKLLVVVTMLPRESPTYYSSPAD